MRQLTKVAANSGLRSFLTGAPRTRTAPRDGSVTQRRKAALRSYSNDERKNSRRAGKTK